MNFSKKLVYFSQILLKKNVSAPWNFKLIKNYAGDWEYCDFRDSWKDLLVEKNNNWLIRWLEKIKLAKKASRLSGNFKFVFFSKFKIKITHKKHLLVSA